MQDDEKKPWPTSKAAAAFVGKAKIPDGDVKTTPGQITLICQMMDKVLPGMTRKPRAKRPGPVLG